MSLRFCVASYSETWEKLHDDFFSILIDEVLDAVVVSYAPVKHEDIAQLTLRWT